MKKTLFVTFCLLLQAFVLSATYTVWEIGQHDSSASDLALGPNGYADYLIHDFGYEDRFFLVNRSHARKDFPYILPGPDDAWAGTSPTAGWRTHETNILFGIDKLQSHTSFRLVVNTLNAHPGGSLLKVSINGQQDKEFFLQGGADQPVQLSTGETHPQSLEVPIAPGVIRQGGNHITLTVLQGSWIVLDNISLQANRQSTTLNPTTAFVREVQEGNYELELEGKRYQPLLVDVEHLEGKPQIDVLVDGKKILTTTIEQGRYQLEAPMPAVLKEKKSHYDVRVEGKTVQKGRIVRLPHKQQTAADYVDTMMGAAHSRWMIAPGPWMPFSMVKLSPDNQNSGWQAGYQPSIESIGCFSHIHEWTMAGLGMMPTNGPLQTTVGDQFAPESGYRSRIDKRTEEAPLGYYRVRLTDTDILAELTGTTRCSFQRYTFPQDKTGRVMIDMHIPSEYDYRLVDVRIRQVSETRIEGFSHQLSTNVWSGDADQEYRIHFVIEFDQPILTMGGWTDHRIHEATTNISGRGLYEAGAFVEFDTQASPVVQIRTGISLVSVSNASANLETEIARPFGWDFEAVVQHQRDEWNELLGRVAITSNNRLEKKRFYTALYRSFCRNTWSDVNGEWMSGDKVKRRMPSPDLPALGCDAFWNTFWNLNQVWNLLTPEWSSRWVQSQLAMYDANGWLAKGPAGMKYIPVMVAEHEIPLIVGAYQMGIRDFDAEKAFRAIKKMQTTPGETVAAGFAGNRDLDAYLTYKYVPYDKGRFSNTLEYAFDDWTVAQLAKALGKESDYRLFAERGEWWRNAFNPQTGYAQLRKSDGSFETPFDPYRTGANHHYVEGNAWQLSHFVPQDIPALVQLVGKDNFVQRLDDGFRSSEQWRFNAPGDQYWDIAVTQGNQQSQHFAYLFNWAGKPWLTQRWTRSIIDKYYGYGVANAYLGDEDQGQMSGWFVMAALGLFQTDGGCRVDPIYEIASPLFEQVTIDLDFRYGRGRSFTIEARNTSRVNKYVLSAQLNGKPLNSFFFPASELLKGGRLILEMGPEPNERWGR